MLHCNQHKIKSNVYSICLLTQYRLSILYVVMITKCRSNVGAIPTNDNELCELCKLQTNVSDYRTRAKRGECRRHEGWNKRGWKNEKYYTI